MSYKGEALVVDYANIRHWAVAELAGCYNASEAEHWLNTPQQLLGGETPLMRIRAGKSQDVVAIVRQLQEGAFV